MESPVPTDERRRRTRIALVAALAAAMLAIGFCWPRAGALPASTTPPELQESSPIGTAGKPPPTAAEPRRSEIACVLQVVRADPIQERVYRRAMALGSLQHASEIPTARPVSGLTLEIRREGSPADVLTKTTDVGGEIRLSAPGRCRITLRDPRYLLEREEHDLVRGRNTIEVRLECRVVARFLDEFGNPVAGLPISVSYDPHGHQPRSMKEMLTDANGQLAFDGVPQGAMFWFSMPELRVVGFEEFESPGFASRMNRSGNRSALGGLVVDRPLSEGAFAVLQLASLSGVIRDGEGTPRSDCAVGLVAAKPVRRDGPPDFTAFTIDDVITTTLTDASGQFSFCDLNPGSYLLECIDRTEHSALLACVDAPDLRAGEQRDLGTITIGGRRGVVVSVLGDGCHPDDITVKIRPHRVSPLPTSWVFGDIDLPSAEGFRIDGLATDEVYTLWVRSKRGRVEPGMLTLMPESGIERFECRYERHEQRTP